jgi:hypothetical protein
MNLIKQNPSVKESIQLEFAFNRECRWLETEGCPIDVPSAKRLKRHIELKMAKVHLSLKKNRSLLYVSSRRDKTHKILQYKKDGTLMAKFIKDNNGIEPVGDYSRIQFTELNFKSRKHLVTVLVTVFAKPTQM